MSAAATAWFAPSARAASRGAGTLLLAGALLAGCTTSPPRDAPAEGSSSVASPAPAGSVPPPRSTASVPSSKPLRPGPRGGAFYKDDGPGDAPPPELERVTDAEPRQEPLHRFANRPYVVFGREYVPATSLRLYRERGLASWYGRKFHGQPTSTGEIYDMYAMTAAHPTLPLPSYARVTSRDGGRSVVVRVNDRGPFHPGRIIDLSYTAAFKLGILERGSGEVEVESILFGMDELIAPLAELASAGVAMPALPVRRDAGALYVQIGAFGEPANAETFAAHAVNQLGAAGVEPRVRRDQGLFRVLVGPFADRVAAGAAIERIRGAIGVNGAIHVDGALPVE